MEKRHLILWVLTSFFVIAAGCAKRIPMSYDQAQPDALVIVKTLSGQSCKGVIQKKEADYLVIKEIKYNSLIRINRNEIASISAHNLEYDGTGKVISEQEIQETKRNKNLFLYTVGGMGLSFGASFFIGSLVHRSTDDTEQANRLMWGTTALGTVAGTYLFAKSGRNRDRILAVETIREQRFNLARKKYDSQKMKSSAIRQQLEKEKAERQRQQEELNRLKQRAKKNKKK